MKFTFAAALLATASASRYQKNWKVWAIDALYKPLTGDSVKDTCGDMPQALQGGVFWRKMLRETHVTGVEALYGEHGIIDDECFGDWMDTTWDPVHHVIVKAKDDFHSVNYNEWQTAGQTLLDMAYRNEDACHFEHIGDDIKTWCLGDEATCFQMAGVWDRVIEGVFPLIMNTVEMFNLARANDICYSDEELIQEYATMWGAMCDNAVIVHGMEPLTWNKDLKLDHINQSDFHAQKKAYKASHQSFGKMMWGTVKSLFE